MDFWIIKIHNCMYVQIAEKDLFFSLKNSGQKFLEADLDPYRHENVTTVLSPKSS